MCAGPQGPFLAWGTLACHSFLFTWEENPTVVLALTYPFYHNDAAPDQLGQALTGQRTQAIQATQVCNRFHPSSPAHLKLYFSAPQFPYNEVKTKTVPAPLPNMERMHLNHERI